MSTTFINRQERAVIELALALYAEPIRYVAYCRTIPFHPSMSFMLRIAGDPAEKIIPISDLFSISSEHLLQAVHFTIQQLCLSEENPYRVLGLNSWENHKRLKLHYHLMMRFLHPDRFTRLESADLYSTKVINAYKELSKLNHHKNYQQTHDYPPPIHQDDTSNLEFIGFISRTNNLDSRLNQNDTKLYLYWLLLISVLSFIFYHDINFFSDSNPIDTQISIKNKPDQLLIKNETSQKNFLKLTSLISKFVYKYESGDLDGVLDLFSQDALINGIQDKQELRELYAKTIHDWRWRKLVFDGFNWDIDYNRAIGHGSLLLWVTKNDTNIMNFSESPCQIEVDLALDEGKIALLHCTNSSNSVIPPI